jgi:hypothetical protein
MRTDLKPGTVVEVTDRGSNNFQYAAVVDQPAGRSAFEPDNGKTVWVRYDNGCTVPIADYFVRALTPDQVVAELNKLRLPRT